MADENIKQKSLELHKKLRGKIQVVPAVVVQDDQVLAEVYTPGVGAVSQAVADGSVALRDVQLLVIV